jgi:hypothetical protein
MSFRGIGIEAVPDVDNLMLREWRYSGLIII